MIAKIAPRRGEGNFKVRARQLGRDCRDCESTLETRAPSTRRGLLKLTVSRVRYGLTCSDAEDFDRNRFD